jgi:aspartate aminotransferase
MEETGWIRRMFEEGLTMKRVHGEENVFDFSLGNPVVEPPEKLREALVETLQRATPGMHRYMPNNGFEDVRTEIARYLRLRYGQPFSSQHVYMSAGSAGGLNILLKSILNKGDEVIVPEPYFMEFKYYIESHGGVIRTVATADDFQLDIGAIEAAITGKTRAILINSPNNPTGAVYSEETLKDLAAVLYGRRKKGKEIYLISDDAYRKVVYEGMDLPNVFAIYDLTISVTSHSKDLALPGERIGYIAISPRVTEADTLVSALMFSSRALGFVNAPALFQRVVGGFQNVSVDIGDYEAKRDILFRTLTEAGFQCTKPMGAFYLFPRSPLEDELEFIRRLQHEERILVVPGRGFGKRGYFRIAYCVPMEKILGALEGFRRMGRYYAS